MNFLSFFTYILILSNLEIYASDESTLPETPPSCSHLSSNESLVSSDFNDILRVNSWPEFQEFVVKGYAQRAEGIIPHEYQSATYIEVSQNSAALIRCAEKNWPNAQQFVAEGYAEGKYGLHQSPVKLYDLGYQKKWICAQALVLEGYAQGKYGFTKRFDLFFQKASCWEDGVDLFSQKLIKEHGLDILSQSPYNTMPQAK